MCACTNVCVRVRVIQQSAWRVPRWSKWRDTHTHTHTCARSHIHTHTHTQALRSTATSYDAQLGDGLTFLDALEDEGGGGGEGGGVLHDESHTEVGLAW